MNKLSARTAANLSSSHFTNVDIQGPNGLQLQHDLLIQDSHQRCTGLGLHLRESLDYSAQAQADFKLAQERCARLQAQARPVMEMLLDQVSGTGNMVCLADAQGTILMSAGRGGAMEFAERVALRPGVSWAESSKGTNAVGTALITETDVYVHADEHFIRANQILTCSASPIMDHSGNVIGVLDVTGDQSSFHPHTLALVKVAARSIENYWFRDHFNRQIRMHFHLQAELIGTVAEGVIAMGPDGRILGINRAGLALLGTSNAGARVQGVRAIFGMGFGELMDRLRSSSLAPLALTLPNGQEIFARAQLSDLSVGQSFAMTPPLGQHRQESVGQTDTPTAPAASTQAELPPKKPNSPPPDLKELARDDATMRSVVDQVSRVLDRDIPLLILGDTGTGKEFLAHAMHRASLRHEQAFVAVNCASIPETLIESELFGYEEGAFTGAKRRGATGKLVQAHGGTLFLDEIGDMPLSMQARLLRVLQERKVVPLGSHKAHEVDISLVCATHRNLREMIAQGLFREDLYYRINGLSVRLPRLQQRSDLAALCQKMIKQFAPNQPLSLSPELLKAFQAYDWPGNLRQLHNVLRTACVMAGQDQQLTRVHLSSDLLEELGLDRPSSVSSSKEEHKAAKSPAPAALGQAVNELALSTIREALAQCQGNVTEAAKLLQISRNTIYRKLKGKP